MNEARHDMVRFFGLQVWVYFYVSWTPLESADVTMSGVSSALET